MIDEYYTFKIFGYHSDDLSYGSGKPIIAMCDKCYTHRKTTLNAYRDLCIRCLYNVYNNIQVMPYGNHGYDFICSKRFKIDVKSSATGDKFGYWNFSIFKNVIADYFLCIAFNSRDDLHNPVHLWLIPGHKINHLSSITIYKSTLNKFVIHYDNIV